MLASSVLVALLLSTTSLSILADGQSGSCTTCSVEKHMTANIRRIPSMITEWNCQQLGASCGTESSFPSKCRQLTGLMDVGYTRKIGDQEMVV
eukprot:01091.XXX_989_658_1 [CDS] Oithona nana genome sequencing.